jgi:Pin2-interacting protein X1
VIALSQSKSHMDVVGKKRFRENASSLNEHAGSAPSGWAEKILEKHGWTKGTGLGKKEDGMVSHIRVKKKIDQEGIGFDVSNKSQDWNQQWWLNTYKSDIVSKTIGGKAAVSLQSDSESDSDSDSSKSEPKQKSFDSSQPSWEDLFKATGGARLGMRARIDQPGKWNRVSDKDVLKQEQTENRQMESKQKKEKKEKKGKKKNSD